MPVALTTLRTTIASALVDNAVYQVFAFPPATVLANSVIVAPDSPYLEPIINTTLLLLKPILRLSSQYLCLTMREISMELKQP